MAFVGIVLLFAGVSWATSCKRVEYEYKQFGVKYYGWGAGKGCFAGDSVTQSETKEAAKDLNVTECSAIKKDGDLTDLGGPSLVGLDDEQLEKICNYGGTIGCIWKGGKCQFASCPDISAKYKCQFGGNFKNGKCEKLTGDKCISQDSGYLPSSSTSSSGADNCYDGTYCLPGTRCTSNDGITYFCETDPNPPCSKLGDYFKDRSLTENYTSDDKKVCEYQCAHPMIYQYVLSPYEYTIPARKYCNNQLGCLYAENGSPCSVWAIWAFVLALVLSILTVVGVVVFIVVAHFVLKLF